MTFPSMGIGVEFLGEQEGVLTVPRVHCVIWGSPLIPEPEIPLDESEWAPECVLAESGGH